MDPLRLCVGRHSWFGFWGSQEVNALCSHRPNVGVQIEEHLEVPDELGLTPLKI